MLPGLRHTHSQPRSRRYPQSHTPCNRCVRFATTVASGHATLATKRTLLLTWTGLPPAGSHQLCLAHSFDHLVGGHERRREDVGPAYPGCTICSELLHGLFY